MNISIVIPVFNERESLPDLVDELVHNLSEYKTWEVIFIDDGSSDGSTEWLSKLCIESKNFKMIQFYRNYGKSAALREGFKAAAGEYIITMDADGEHNPSDIPRILESLFLGNSIVVTNRLAYNRAALLT